MDRNEVARLLKGLLATYPNTKITDRRTTLESWFSIFAPEEASVVFNAARMYMCVGKFFPQPSEIRRYIPIVKAAMIKAEEESTARGSQIALESSSVVNEPNVSSLTVGGTTEARRDCESFCPYYAIGKCFGDNCKL